MNRKKTFVFSMALALGMLGTVAAEGTPGIKFLLSNGQRVGFAFSTKPKITFNGTGVTVTAEGKDDVSYEYTNVKNMYYRADINWTGIEQVKGDAAEREPVFGYAGGVLSVSGMAACEQLSVYAISGSLMTATKADSEGNASVDLSNAPAGVYVVGTDSGVSFKLLKK